MSKASASGWACVVSGLATLGVLALVLILLATPVSAQTGGPPPSPDSDPAYLFDYDDVLTSRYLREQLGGAQRWQLLRPDVLTYVVQEGDNDWSIAQRFGLDVDTLRFSNDWMRRNPDLIHPGKEVIVLPVKGAYYEVQAGDSLTSIAQRYGVDPFEILQFPLNNLQSAEDLQPGMKLVIPGGRLDYADRILPPGPGTSYALAWPLRGTVTQGFHSGHQAIDIASYYGAKVYAAASGRVEYARFSPDGWLGFRVVIAHDNGLRTGYSHLSGIFVEEGQWVSRGEVIGQMGSTGNSTGPHIHFQVYSGGTRANPYAYLPPSPAQ